MRRTVMDVRALALLPRRRLGLVQLEWEEPGSGGVLHLTPEQAGWLADQLSEASEGARGWNTTRPGGSNRMPGEVAILREDGLEPAEHLADQPG